MKFQSEVPILVTAVLVVFSTVSVLQPAHAKPKATAFVCGQSKGVPATLAQTPGGNVPVIRWTSNVFQEAGYDAQTRCKMVSSRFQNYFQNQQLTYLTTGKINGQNVVCVAQVENGGCARDLPEEGLLFTLKPGTNPGQTLRQLMQVRVKASGPLNESARPVYINMEEFVRTTPVDTEASIDSSIKPAAVPPRVNPPKTQIGVW
ncbi:hypothetical protein F7734_09575 [Scytonema sp. UIC 10036]|uniref:COP23 domain-containing protein n=1 Tax=Scytonema sp. UIC 10036 TaxID=2304196 RepID=UPI0012DA3A76|nr:COP23 domain-containing protein [Scytonema sp. UIC 10036]MUG92688.1 hypothetical protein [Scytonema sp. UIC 10036]